MEHLKFLDDMDDPMTDADVQDYNVLPRPPELVYSQLLSSSSPDVPEAKSNEKALRKRLEKNYSKGILKKLKKKTEKSKPGSPSLDASPKFLRSSPASPVSDEYYLSQDQQRKKLKEQALAAQERYDILNKRDSDLRERETTRVDTKRKVIKGTCPDMCPEKERYSRVAKNCLSFFEMKKGLDPSSNSKDVDHRFMVKEYSRSSADQQEPLPNELRPVSVLKFTMDYLICNIVDKQDDSIPIAEWYDFIWNRTRSIRKDITQQQLGDVESVGILEKCARFHILCAEFLSEEDTATFDPKINNENLTKCLQTLKHMYYDLQTKGVQCPNEAEFRAYDILLSLSEGETLRLVKDIRKEVFKTSHVKLAFDAALAFKSNNFVKFFNLMERAPYLSSCIMHRYMHEARIRAMNVIVRSYTVQNKPTLYPLLSLVRDLKFKDTSEAAQFCSWHGLTIDETDVILQKQIFRRPSSTYPVERSSFLVGKKLESGFGVIVNNGPLPENPLTWYQPYSSFDENGTFVEENIDIDIEEESMSQERREEEPSSPEVSDKEDDEPCYPDTQLEKENSQFFEPFASPSSIRDLDEEIPIPQHQLEIKAQPSPFLSPSSVKEDVAVKASIPFSFKSTQAFSTSPSALHSPLMSKFFSKEPPPPVEVIKEKTTPKSPFEERSSGKTFGWQSSEAKSPVVKASSQSFKWPTFEGYEEDDDDDEEDDTPVVDVPGEESREDSIMETQSERNEEDENSCPESEEKKSDYGSETIEMPFLEPEPVSFRNSPEIYISATEDISIPDVEKTIDSYDKVDEETLQKIREEKISELVSTIADEVNVECIKELSFDICSETLSEERNVKQKLDDYMAEVKDNLCRKVFYKWKLFCERKKQRRACVEPLSPWTPMLMNRAYVTSGASNPFSAYKKHRSFSRLAENKIKENVLKPGWEPIVDKDLPEELNYLFFSQVYMMRTNLETFLKVGVILLKFKDEDIDVFEDWIFKKFNFATEARMNMPKGARLCYRKGGKNVICFSAITLSPDTTDGLDDFIRGTSAVILFCPRSFPNLKVFQSVLEKLTQLIEPAGLFFPFPVYCCLLPIKHKIDVVDQLNTYINEQLYTSCVFSSVRMSELTDPSRGERNSKELSSAISWLSRHLKPLPVLRYSTVINYIKDSYISAFNWVFWKLSLPEFKPLYQVPEHIINFYNKVLDFRAEVLCSSLMTKLSQYWPPKELLIRKPDHDFIKINFQNKLAEFFKNLRLPDFSGDPLSQLDLWNYAKVIIGTRNADSEMLFICIKEILEKSPEVIDWPKIISKCANYLICYHSSKIENYLEETVYYLKEELKDEFEVYWKTVLLSFRKDNSSGMDLKTSSKKRKLSDTSDFEQRPQNKKNISLMSDKADDFNKPDDLIQPDDVIQPDDLNKPILSVSNVPDVSDVTTNRVSSMLKSLKETLTKLTEEEDGLTQKLNESITGNTSKQLLKDIEPLKDTFLSDTFSSPYKELATNASILFPNASPKPVKQPKQEKNPPEAASSADIWRTIIGKNFLPEVCTTSRLSEKLDDLRYNIKRNNILEDNLSLLLDCDSSFT